MKNLAFILSLIPILVVGQEIKSLNPTLGWVVEKSLQGEIEQLKHMEMCEVFWKAKKVSSLEKT